MALSDGFSGAMLDVLTLIILLSGACFLVSVTFLTTWVHSRFFVAYGWWAVGFALGGAGLALMAGRDVLPDWLSIDIANSAILMGIGLCWVGARTFDGKPAHHLPVFVPTIVWLILCQVPAYYESTQLRVVGASLLMASLAFLISWELCRNRVEWSKPRLALVLLCFTQGVVFTARGMMALVLGMPQSIFEGQSWFALSLAQPFVLMFLAVLFILGVDRRRTERELERVAAADPLTPALNRRGFVERCDRVLAQKRLAREDVALLVFDLDHFKRINDRFGHLAGDRALIAFCEVALNHLRSGDVFGRLGGEEFAALLTDAGHDTAAVVAERIRMAFNRHAVDYNGVSILATVSAGIAVMPSRTANFAQLMEQADAALYDAKAAGRNRVSQHLSKAS